MLCFCLYCFFFFFTWKLTNYILHNKKQKIKIEIRFSEAAFLARLSGIPRQSRSLLPLCGSPRTEVRNATLKQTVFSDMARCTQIGLLRSAPSSGSVASAIGCCGAPSASRMWARVLWLPCSNAVGLPGGLPFAECSDMASLSVSMFPLSSRARPGVCALRAVECQPGAAADLHSVPLSPACQGPLSLCQLPPACAVSTPCPVCV